jgi:hypothetical protein
VSIPGLYFRPRAACSPSVARCLAYPRGPRPEPATLL